MISGIEGKVEEIGDKYVVISAGGVGYTLTVVPKILPILAKSQGPVKMHVYSRLNLREGEFELYGFTTRADLELFRILTSVSGLGPKTAMNVLSTVDPAHLKEAVVNEDPQALRKVSGLGNKTAQRLVVELQGKVDWIDSLGAPGTSSLHEEHQALEALMALGYSQGQSKEALAQVAKEAKDLRDRVRLALKVLGK
ncbi:MAG TPA: Holliday junction branch migration protein RuvA [Candidatus Paceibacterota bacterium]|nr:Holliday junction branch migration protein RuvA [Candidatus Paceibacterota bacterium]